MHNFKYYVIIILFRDTSDIPKTQSNSTILFIMRRNIAVLHGAWGDPLTVQSLVVGLQKLTDNVVTSIQLVGHGTEAFTPKMGSFGLREYEDDILKKLPSDETILVGYSMGAVCGFNLAQRHPKMVKGVVMIDPPMLGGVADVRVTKALMSKPLRYLLPLFTNGLFSPTYEDAKMMLFNGEESPHLDRIVRQPAAGKAIRQMLFGRLPSYSRRPCGLVIAGDSRLHPESHKRAWAKKVHANWNSLAGSHCGILEDRRLPEIVHQLVERVSI